jgi:hypothetical protein
MKRIKAVDETITPGKIIAWLIGLIVFLTALAWFSDANDLMRYKFFGPKYEAARRETYEQTKSFRTGSIQRLNILCAQINGAEEGRKPMLRAVAVQEFAEWNTGDVPDYLRDCLATARSAN